MFSRAFVGAAVASVVISSGAHAAGYSQPFHRSGRDVFAALTEALPSLGFKVKSTDTSLQRVSFSAGMSAFSWGEDMSIAVIDRGAGESVLEMDGELKMSTNILAQGRVMKHFNNIVMDVSRRLDKTPVRDTAPAEADAKKPPIIQLSLADTLDWSKARGPNTIKANALLRTRGGEVRTCAGLPAKLVPFSGGSQDFVVREFGSDQGGLKSSAKWSASNLDPYIRDTICNAQGDFSFENLPDGKYYVVAVVTWEAPSGGQYSYMQQQGGTLARLVEVSGGETKSVVVTQ